jgi:protein-disulfide isomerase
MTPFVVHCRSHAALVAVLLLSGAACTEKSTPRLLPDSTAGATTSAQRSPSNAASPPAAAPRSDTTRAKQPRTTAAKPSTPARASGNAPARHIEFGGVDFTGVGYDRGDQRAPVIMIDLSDFACPYCGEFAHDVFPTIDREYVQTGKVLFKYIPFVAGSFRHATEATRAAECTADQGQFWQMMERLYVTQTEWKNGNVADAQMAALAGTLPIDSAKFAACYASRRTDARTARATAVANDIGVRVTPSFLVDGHPVQGALPVAEFRKLIETALLVESARKPAPVGTPR